MESILSSLGYGLLGILLLIIGVVFMNLVIPYKFTREIFEEKSVATGVFVAGIFIGLAIIIRSVIIGG
ncbi:MAG: DUF350 domain-containing protein [Bacteroides sp.]|nr:DUF350 domain-containing protein [Bacteroides sp.]